MNNIQRHMTYTTACDNKGSRIVHCQTLSRCESKSAYRYVREQRFVLRNKENRRSLAIYIYVLILYFNLKTKDIALAVAEFWAEEMGPEAPTPCYRLASDIDFLRGVVGVKTQVDVVDDADSHEITIKKMKAATDVSAEETMSKERWNAVKWVMGQLRIICDNKYDASFEPKGTKRMISHKEFYNIINENHTIITD